MTKLVKTDFCKLCSCTVYRDDEAAIAIDKEEHMLKWMEDDTQNLWIDRYDVRYLAD